MYVKNLTIKNFRCFAHAEVSLNYPGRKGRGGGRLPSQIDNVTLFIGPNGSGKTTIFQALCLSVLAPIIAGSGLRIDYFVRRPSGYSGDSRTDGIASRPLANGNIIADLLLDDWDVPSASAPSSRVLGQAVIQSLGDTENLTTAHNNPGVWERIYQNKSPAFFLVAYGANRRAANPEGYTERERSVRYQRVASIFEEYAGLVPFTFGFLELSRLQRLPEALRILNGLLPESVRLTDQVDHEGSPLFDATGVLHPFTGLSDGYRGFVAWVWDLLVQMARAMPLGSEGQDLSCLRGVVIVDEVDLFLHPLWQRFLIEELAKQFPGIQFLFSTHSPLVVGMLEAANLRVLNRTGEESVIEQYEEEVEGKTPNELLRSAYFGLSSTRSPRSGTISEQAERDIALEGALPWSEERRIGAMGEDQMRALNRLMAQSREFGKAQHRAEQETSEGE